MRSISILLLLAILAGCSNLRIEKRRFRKGFHIHWTKKQRSNSKKEDYTFKKTNESYSDSLHVAMLETNAPRKIKTPKEHSINPTKPLKTSKSKRNTHKTTPHKQQTVIAKETPSKTIKKTVPQTLSPLKKQKEHSSYLALLFFALAGVTPLFMFNSKNHKHSVWAAKNPRKARRRIAGLQVGILSISALLGEMLHLPISQEMGIIAGTTAGLSFVAANYSKKKNVFGQNRTRLFFMNLFNFSGAFGAFSLGNSGIFSNPSRILDWSATSGITEMAPGDHDGPFVLPTGVAVTLFVLLIVLLILMAGYTIILACALTCIDQILLALLVAFSGSITFTFLSIVAGKSIFKRKSDTDEKLPLWLIITLIVVAVVFLCAVGLGISALDAGLIFFSIL